MKAAFVEVHKLLGYSGVWNDLSKPLFESGRAYRVGQRLLDLRLFKVPGMHDAKRGTANSMVFTWTPKAYSTNHRVSFLGKSSIIKMSREP